MVVLLLILCCPAMTFSGASTDETEESYDIDGLNIINACKNISISHGQCTTIDANLTMRYIGYCPYYFKFNSHLYSDHHTLILNVKSCSVLNDAMCGQLNRDGLLCSKCKDGYGPALYSKSWKCEKCNNRPYLMWFLYLLLEFTPLTVFFIIVIIFNVRATSPPFTAYVFYCQYIADIFRTNKYLHFYITDFINPYVYRLILSIIDVWYLDFFRRIIPKFCISSNISNIQIIFFQLIPAVFPLFLIFLTYVFIELHARNVYIIVLLWRPFNRCVAKVRRSYDPKASIFNAFSTFILLSYSKILFIGSRVFYSMPMVHKELLDTSNAWNTSHTFYYDPNEPRPKLAPYYVPSIVVLALFSCFPLLLLILYPIKIFRRKCLFYICCKDLRFVRSFVDAFQGHYKDGTNGTCDLRALASLQLIIRIIYIRDSWYKDDSNYKSLMAFDTILLTIVSMIYYIIQPCKKRYMNAIEGSLYSFIVILSTLSSRVYFRTVTTWKIITSYIILFLIFTPSVIVIVLFVYKLLVKIPTCNSFIQYMKQKYLLRCRKTTDYDILPHRIIAPKEYTPLI